MIKRQKSQCQGAKTSEFSAKFSDKILSNDPNHVIFFLPNNENPKKQTA